MEPRHSRTTCISIQPDVRKQVQPADASRPVTVKVQGHPLVPSVRKSGGGDSSYQPLLQSLYDAALITDFTGKITDANARAIDFLQHDRAALCALQVLDIISGADDSLLQTIRENLENERFTHIEAYCVRKDASIFPAEIVVNQLRHATERQLAFFIRDITRRRQVEEAFQKNKSDLEEMNRRLQENQTQLVQSEKMAALGQIAAGVAHEINNPVGFVTSNLATLTEYIAIFKKLLARHEDLAAAVQAGDVARQHEILAQIEAIRSADDLPYVVQDVDHLLAESVEGTTRVKEIVQGLRSFARLDESELKEANINDGIEATLRMIWNELKYKCQVHKKLGQLPSIRCYPGQLNQVLLNLLVNAAQAIPEQGEITIETEATDKHIVIQISDTGTGIAPEHLSKLFTPFFTTKPVGHGTGLGLSVSYGIVQKHNGTIEAQSEVGKGTTFIIRLPIEGVPHE